MGILDDLDKEKQNLLNRPDPWPDSEDKIEEWIGILPPGSMKPKKKKPDSVKQEPPARPPQNTTTPNRMIIDVVLISNVGDIILPGDFKNQVEYARVLKLQSSKIGGNCYPGYIIEVTIGKLLHRRRVFDPINTIKEAYQSSEFILALTKAIKAISDYR